MEEGESFFEMTNGANIMANHRLRNECPFFLSLFHVPLRLIDLIPFPADDDDDNDYEKKKEREEGKE